MCASDKKRDAYMSEMQRLRQGQQPARVGPQGSLTISDIRLPLKQEFMHKIGGPQGQCVTYQRPVRSVRDLSGPQG